MFIKGTPSLPLQQASLLYQENNYRAIGKRHRFPEGTNLK
jgi:hypothetical protein